MGKMNLFTVRATAKKIRRRTVFLKLASVVGGISTFILLIFYGMAIFANSVGSFTVNTPKESEGFNLALCENPEFNESFNKLFADPVDEMDNTSEKWIPEDVDEYNGSHNGVAHIAYTFYVMNMGNSPIGYTVTIDIEELVGMVDEAIRVKVYLNGEPTVYAKAKKDSTEPEPNTTPFYSSKQVMCIDRNQFMAGEYDKYTIVIWLEGNDPECTDEIKGGKIKFSMNFSVLSEKN